jgi:periplasmic protein TonB
MGKSIFVCWEDLVFEKRNKEYGAYALRYTYPYYLSIAAGIVILAFLIGVLGPVILKEEEVKDTSKKTTHVLDYSQLSAPPPIEQIQKPKTVVVEQPKVEKYVAPVITQEEVVEEEEMMTIEEVKENLASTDSTVENTEGVETEIVATPVETTAPVEEVVVVPPEPVHVPVVVDPSFPGGKSALKKWLEKRLEYPSMAVRMGIEGTVMVQFRVSESGKITDVSVIKSLHKLCDAEAMRLVKSMPDWQPGSVDGVATTQIYTQPITFKLE